MDIYSIIKLICGLTFFLFGMKVMSGSLERMAGGKLELMLKKMTVREKLGQLTQLHTDHDIEPSVEERLRRGELGGFLAAGGTWDNEEYAKELRLAITDLIFQCTF
mgnify:CR=1 FL=1